jgi:glutathione S-transferase
MVPVFYGLLAATEEAAQNAAIEELQGAVTSLVQAADERGPYFLGEQMCLVDVHLTPFVLRMSRILQPIRGWTPPVPESRWQVWVDAIESNVHVRNTVSAERLYVETVDLLAKGKQALVGG